MSSPESGIQTQLQTILNSLELGPRAPIWHWPEEVGLEYENIFFPAEDEVVIEGWLIPCKGSNKVIIANHPRWFNRAGLPSHLHPWNKIMPGGNDFDVNFVNDYKILHDAGYNILAYDMRNLGHSSSANGGVISGGRYEARDVVGAINYIRKRQDTKDMPIGLFGRCNGANAMLFAMTDRPGVFEGVRCMVAAQPLSLRVVIERALEQMNIPAKHIDDIDQGVRIRSSFGIDQMTPTPWAKSVRVPTFLYQVHDDPATRPSDVQSVHDNIPIADKKLHWIHGTTVRWDGYTYFQKEPQQFLDWFARFMA